MKELKIDRDLSFKLPVKSEEVNIIIIYYYYNYFNTELFHNIKLTKYIQRENKMSDLPIGHIYM
jgi:hypothetical protein